MQQVISTPYQKPEKAEFSLNTIISVKLNSFLCLLFFPLRQSIKLLNYYSSSSSLSLLPCSSCFSSSSGIWYFLKSALIELTLSLYVIFSAGMKPFLQNSNCFFTNSLCLRVYLILPTSFSWMSLSSDSPLSSSGSLMFISSIFLISSSHLLLNSVLLILLEVY